MYPCFDVDGISVQQLPQEWNWLVTGEFKLLAINAFGDLFLKNVVGAVHRLDISGGTIVKIADSESEFRNAAKEVARQEEWFLIEDEKKAAQKGCAPQKGQCVGSKIPWVFKESASVPNNLVVANLYGYVSLMGDVLGQMRDVPDGGKIRLRVEPRPNPRGSAEKKLPGSER
jgi:hypothetical protein